MSKRKSQTAVSDYIAEGFIREALVNYLALLGWATGTEEEVLSIDEIVGRFELDHVHKGGAVFDRERLEWLNGQWIRRLEPDDLIDRLRPFVEADLAAGRIDVMPSDDDLRSLLPIITERLPRLGAIGDLVGFLWVRELTSTRPCSCPSDGMRPRPTTASSPLGRRSPRRRGLVRGRRARTAAPRAGRGRGWKVGDLFMAIRVAVTGRTATPPLFDTIVALGLERDPRTARPSHRAASDHVRPGAPARPRRRRRPARGLATQIGQSVLPDGVSQAANSISPWLLAAFLLGSRDARSTLGGRSPASAPLLRAPRLLRHDRSCAWLRRRRPARSCSGGWARSSAARSSVSPAGPGGTTAPVGGGPAPSGCSRPSRSRRGSISSGSCPSRRSAAASSSSGSSCRSSSGGRSRAIGGGIRRGPAGTRARRDRLHRLPLVGYPDSDAVTDIAGRHRDATRGRTSLARPLYRGLVVYDETAIGDLFAETCDTATSRGRSRSSAGPRSSPIGCRTRTSPGPGAAHYDVWAFDGERASGFGESRYTNPDGSLQDALLQPLPAPLRWPRCMRRVHRVLHGAAGEAARVAGRLRVA